MGLSYRRPSALLELQASQKFWVHMYVDRPQTEPIEVLILITPKGERSTSIFCQENY